MSDYTPTVAQVRLNHQRSRTVEVGIAEAGAEFDRLIADAKADAWDEGLQAGWEECQNPGPFVNDWWDSKAPNPHRIEVEA